MSEAHFDAANAVTFDLPNGLVHIEGTPSRLLVPAAAITALAQAAGPDAARAFARAIGEPIGARVAARLGASATVDAMVNHLGGELALVGLGSLSIERWGRAVVVVIDHSPAADSLLEGVLEAAIGAATKKAVRALAVDREGARSRFLISGERGVEKVRGWIARGVSWGEALVRLHAGGAS